MSVFLYFIVVTNRDVILFYCYWHHLNHRKHTCGEVWLIPNIYKANIKKNTWKLSETYFTLK
jgi:hypothetical protein